MHETCLNDNSRRCASAELERALAETDRPTRGEREPLDRFLKPPLAARDRGDWIPPHLGVRLKAKRDVTRHRQFGREHGVRRYSRRLPGVGDRETARRVECDTLLEISTLEHHGEVIAFP